MNRLDGKIVFVSGAAIGIGAATAAMMAEAGAKVALGDILGETGEQVAAGIRARGGARWGRR